jgi:hypothetical protein
MKTKICSKCKQEKSLSDFPNQKSTKDGLFYWCRDCCKEYGIKNKIRIKNHAHSRYLKNKEKILQKCREYHKEHREDLLQQMKNYRDTHKEERKEYLELNRKETRNYVNNKKKTDLNFRLSDCLRHRIYKSLKGINKSAHTIELLGCSIEQLKNHLEKQFRPGMSWDNYGYYGWHVDHIRPCASFDLSKPEEQRKCFHFTNLQPLWMKENISKQDKFL